jgi:DNA-binding transcriptional ArsR family regulator
MQPQKFETADTQAELFAVLSSATRIRILRVIAEDSMTVGKIAESIGMSLQNTSHHLRFMRDKGVLTSRRKGQNIEYSIAHPRFIGELLGMAKSYI